MRKRIYAILLATVLAGSLASGCMTAFASETEAAISGTEAEVSEALAAGETEAETEAEAAEPAGLAPKEMDKVLGRKFSTDTEAGTPLSWDIIE